MKRKLLLPILMSVILTGCSSITIIKSPSEDKGLEGNAENDVIPEQTTKDLENLLKSVVSVKRYSFDVTVNIPGYEEHVKYYITPYAIYEEADNKADSVGYAMTKSGNYIFKYYLSDDEKEVYPSVYEYGGMGDSIEKVSGLYSAFSFAHISMLSESMSDFSAVRTGVNKFAITDSTTASVFQYMTNYGSFTVNYMTSLLIDVINFETQEFKVNIDMGSIGSIDCIFTPLKETKIDFVSTACFEGRLVGVDSYDDTSKFFNMMSSNNFVLEGIKQTYSNGSSLATYPYRINCTNDYFYLDYTSEYAANYNSFGFALVEKGKEVTIHTYDTEGKPLVAKQKLDYDACYKFTKDKSSGEFYYSDFIGPLPSSNLTYLEVESLPKTGETGVLYICKNAQGEKVVYEWVDSGTGEYVFKEYSSWYNSVGEFPIDGKSATFYLGGTPLVDIGANYFEKDHSKENTYFCKENGILNTLSNGLFGVGFQQTPTWMDYVTKANLTLNKVGEEIVSADLGLSLMTSIQNVGYGEQKIYYTIKDFNNANVSEIEEFLKGGNNNA